MKKLLATLAIAGLAGGFAAGTATADEQEVPGAGTVHYGQDNGGYVVAEGDGANTPDGYIGVEGNNGVVAACNAEGESYSAGNGDPFDPAALADGSGDTSCLG
jgi:hypothetical protein